MLSGMLCHVMHFSDVDNFRVRKDPVDVLTTNSWLSMTSLRISHLGPRVPLERVALLLEVPWLES